MPSLARVPSAVRRIGGSAVALWAAFVIVHLWLGFVNLYGAGLPLGDVSIVYKFWVERGIIGGQWVGIDTSWVYPILALLPMLAAYSFGPELYASTWLTLVMTLNAAAFVTIVGVDARARHATIAWWWMLYLALLGPIALGRIDSVTVPVALVGALLIVDHPRWAGALLAVGAWIKVWPAALLLAAIIALKNRAAATVSAVGTSMVVLAGGLAVGAGLVLFSAISEQTGRGLQVEAPVSTVWLWAAATGSWNARVYYDQSILTWQVIGDGTPLTADLMTPLLALVVLVIIVLGIVAVRRGVDEARLLSPLALALVMALISINKVGSPQFASWIAVPVILGLAWRFRGGVSFVVPASLALVVAGLTQLVYPVLYGSVLSLEPTMLVVLTARNLLYLVVLCWAVRQLVLLCRQPGAPDGLTEPTRAIGVTHEGASS